jgi:hypothetical protein
MPYMVAKRKMLAKRCKIQTDFFAVKNVYILYVENDAHMQKNFFVNNC